MSNIFNVFDFSFVYWIAFGAFTVLIVAGAASWFKDKGILMNWWRWILLLLWYIGGLVGISAPFTIMGEKEIAAGWRILAFNLPIIIISGFIVWRIIAIGRKKQAV